MQCSEVRNLFYQNSSNTQSLHCKPHATFRDPLLPELGLQKSEVTSRCLVVSLPLWCKSSLPFCLVCLILRMWKIAKQNGLRRIRLSILSLVDSSTRLILSRSLWPILTQSISSSCTTDTHSEATSKTVDMKPVWMNQGLMFCRCHRCSHKVYWRSNLLLLKWKPISAIEGSLSERTGKSHSSWRLAYL